MDFSTMTALDGALVGAAAVAVVLLAAALLFAVARRRGGRALEGDIESLRDEIWELRAAAEARDRAEAASQAKSRFLATVSHEIRTPLNGILGLAQLLAMTRLDGEQASYVDAISDCSRSLARLIDDILDFSRIEAGRLELREEPFALAPLVDGVLELLAPRAQEKGLEIASVVAPAARGEFIGDAARLRQVLVNLLGNAVKFTQSGGVGLRVFLDADAALRFDVADTGPGVPESAREAIFEDFEQGDASAARRQEGAGLGLAISRRLVAQMGGRLELAHSGDKGAIFAVTLPARRAAEPQDRGAPLDGQRIFVIAGGLFEGACLAETLAAAGAETEQAASEAQGLARLTQAPANFDAVLVDCRFGADAAEKLAQAARAAGARRLYVLFSPLERRAFGEAALQYFDGWLVKPVRADSLLARLSPAAPPPSRDAPVAAAPTLDGFAVLLAEDNDVNALIVSRFLQKLGARVTRAENGLRAVDKVEAALDAATPFDAILMDRFMPELDGLAATRRIREAETRAQAAPTPIIAVTASAQEDDARAAQAAGVDALLAKPVELAGLCAAILAVRNSARPEPLAAPQSAPPQA